MSDKKTYPLSLVRICKKYVAHIDKIEHCTDKARLQSLEEQRVKLHYKVMDALKRAGITYQDRWEVTDLAYKIARSR